MSNYVGDEKAVGSRNSNEVGSGYILVRNGLRQQEQVRDERREKVQDLLAIDHFRATALLSSP